MNMSTLSYRALLLAKFAFIKSGKGLECYRFQHSKRIFDYLGSQTARDAVFKLDNSFFKRGGIVEVMQELQIIAILHDVVEDCADSLSFDDFSKFPLQTVDSIFLLSRNSYRKQTYMEYIKRVALDPYARFVKIQDLRGHLVYAPGDTLKSQYEEALRFLEEAGPFKFI